MSFPWANEYKPQASADAVDGRALPLPRLVYNAVGGGYPVPRNLNYWWNFGVLSGGLA
jgi:ubiquinol-cytochrome c reductase cytochrome b subunit